MNRRESGFSIVTAIFLLVVLAMLGAFMLMLSGTQQVTTAMDVQGSQAFRAARTGLEWGIAKVKTNAPCSASFPKDMTVEGYRVSVTCTRHADAYKEGGVDRFIYWLESTATRGGAVGGIGYVERRVNAFVEFPT